MEHSSNKKKYQQFVNENSDIPIFLQPWWMDAVCKPNDEWEVLFYEENETIKGVLVYYFTIRFGLKFIIQPQLTQYNGIWLKYETGISGNQKLSFEKKAIGQLLVLIKKEKFDYFNQNFPLQFTNWLPFYWDGFRQTTRYTLQLNNINDTKNLLNRFKDTKKRQIKKANKTLKVKVGMNSSDFYQLLELYFGSRGEKVSYSQDFFEKLYTGCKKHHQGEIITIEDSQEKVHAAIFAVWDKQKAYNLIPAIHPEFKNSGASSLVYYETIKFVADKVSIFDFEGSMDKGIENSYSQFGAEQVPYLNIQKHNSWKSKLIFSVLRKK